MFTQTQTALEWKSGVTVPKLTKNQLEDDVKINVPSQAEICVEWCGKVL